MSHSPNLTLPKRSPRARLNVLSFTLMLREFQAGPCSASDLVAVVGYQRHTIVAYLRTMHRHHAIHVVGYERDILGRQRSPIFALGEGKDAPRKAPDHWDVTNARYRARKVLRLIEKVAA